jgi:hypothetical protein
MIAHQSVADILRDHVRLSVEGIDRMYLNVYVPQLQCEQGVVRFFKYHRGQPLPSAALMSPLSRGFVAQLERFVTEHGIPLVQFRKGERKDAVMDRRRQHDPPQPALVVDKAVGQRADGRTHGNHRHDVPPSIRRPLVRSNRVRSCFVTLNSRVSPALISPWILVEILEITCAPWLRPSITP